MGGSDQPAAYSRTFTTEDVKWARCEHYSPKTDDTDGYVEIRPLDTHMGFVQINHDVKIEVRARILKPPPTPKKKKKANTWWSTNDESESPSESNSEEENKKEKEEEVPQGPQYDD